MDDSLHLCSMISDQEINTKYVQIGADLRALLMALLITLMINDSADCQIALCELKLFLRRCRHIYLTCSHNVNQYMDTQYLRQEFSYVPSNDNIRYLDTLLGVGPWASSPRCICYAAALRRQHQCCAFRVPKVDYLTT